MGNNVTIDSLCNDARIFFKLHEWHKYDPGINPRSGNSYQHDAMREYTIFVKGNMAWFYNMLDSHDRKGLPYYTKHHIDNFLEHETVQ